MDARRLRRRALSRYGAVVWLCCLASAAPLNAATPPPAFFDYLYIEASSGSSAGGHAAVRFGDQVYHFQHDTPGVISPTVQSWASFDLDYRGLGNRPIHVQRIVLPGDDAERLRSAFHQRYVVQRNHNELLVSAARDVELLACLAGEPDTAGGDCGVDLAGAGYFFTSSATDDSSAVPPRRTHPLAPSLGKRGGTTQSDDALPAPFSSQEKGVWGLSSPLTGLRLEIERLYGRDDLSLRRHDVRSRIERLRTSRQPDITLRDGVITSAKLGFADTYADLLLEWLALAVIAGEAQPVPAAFREIPGGLSPSERQALAQREAYQQRVALELLTSTRADRGYALMISLARQVAARASLDRGQLVVVDTFAQQRQAVSSAALADWRVGFERTLHERRLEMARVRAAALSAPAAGELLWSRFEVVANVTLELEGALVGQPLRRHQDELAPMRQATFRRQWPVPRLHAGERQVARAMAVDRHERLTRELRRLYGYDLVSRNCVTEIFRTLDGAGDAILGGRVPMRATANFIPFVSANAVRATYAVSTEVVLPSYRQLALSRLLEASDSWTTRVREETSLTSTLVPFDPSEEIFLFFSTDAVATRPLVGVANVIFGVGAIAGGVLAAPFDGAALLVAGARGVFYSAPELVFMNIRKSQVPLLPANWTELTPPVSARAPAAASGQGGPNPVRSASYSSAAGAASTASPAPAAAGAAAAPPPM